MQTEYAGLRLADTMAEVKYAEGYPPFVVQNPENAKADGNPFSFFEVIETKTLSGDQKLEDCRSWEYPDDQSKVRIDVEFDAPTKTLNSIFCYSEGSNACPAILGISVGTDEAAILADLGKPSEERIDGITKIMKYNSLNAWFYLTKKKVYMLGLKSDRPVDKAPPCKSGSLSCEPWERDWSKLAISPGAIVTNSGELVKPGRADR